MCVAADVLFFVIKTFCDYGTQANPSNTIDFILIK